MKRILAVLLLMLFFCGCNKASDVTRRGTELRQRLLEGKGCRFTSVINADFGELEYSFTLDCTAEEDGTLSFTVLKPESIADITGYINDQTGNLTFDEAVLAFPPLAEGEMSPVYAPWLFYKALSGGYIRAGGREETGYRLTIDDSYRGENLVLEVWLDEGGKPAAAEIVWQGRRLLSLQIVEFAYL